MAKLLVLLFFLFLLGAIYVQAPEYFVFVWNLIYHVITSIPRYILMINDTIGMLLFSLFGLWNLFPPDIAIKVASILAVPLTAVVVVLLVWVTTVPFLGRRSRRYHY